MSLLNLIAGLLWVSNRSMQNAVAAPATEGLGTCHASSEVVLAAGVYAYSGRCSNGLDVVVFYYAVSEMLWVDTSTQVSLALGQEYAMPYFERFPDGYRMCSVDTNPCRKRVNAHLRGGLASVALLVLNQETKARLEGRIATAIEIQEWDVIGPYVFTPKGTRLLKQLVEPLLDAPVAAGKASSPTAEEFQTEGEALPEEDQ